MPPHDYRRVLGFGHAVAIHEATPAAHVRRVGRVVLGRVGPARLRHPLGDLRLLPAVQLVHPLWHLGAPLWLAGHEAHAVRLAAVGPHHAAVHEERVAVQEGEHPLFDVTAHEAAVLARLHDRGAGLLLGRLALEQQAELRLPPLELAVGAHGLLEDVLYTEGQRVQRAHLLGCSGSGLGSEL